MAHRCGSRVAVVSGASSGIGAAVAEEFLSRGHVVVGVSRRGNDRLADRADYLDCRVDLRDGEATESALAQLSAKVSGQVDAVIVNAGVSPPAEPLGRLPWSVVADTYESNVRTALNLVQATAPMLQRNGGGSVTFVGASIANGEVPERWAYAASKAAMTALMRTCSVEFAKDQIVCNEVRPGPVGTPMTLGAGDHEISDHLLEMLNQGFDTDWLKSPRTVAEWIATLAEFPANGPTGQVFNYSRRAL